MLFQAERAALNVARDEARDLFEKTGDKPKVLSAKNLDTFFSELRYAIRLVFEEKEIVFFACMQWVVIAIAYLIWTEMLDWIPDSVWEEVGKSDEDIAFTLLNLALLAWSFFVVAVASYPISILNAAMTAAHYLRSAGQTSTVPKCLNLAFKNLGKLWIFTTIDAWITVNAILDRLPRKRNNRTALDELLYYAWKIGTIGVVPSLVAGKGFTGAAKESVSLLINHPARAVGIRMGYSLICWIIGVTTYIGAFYYFIFVKNSIGAVNEIYRFYVFMAVPIVLAVGVTAVLVRPFYLVMVSKFYTDVVTIDTEATALSMEKKFNGVAFIFALMCAALLAAYFFADVIGVRALIENLAAQDLLNHRMLKGGN